MSRVEPVHPRWAQYPLAYRQKEMQTIASWIVLGESGVVVGLAGTGRATLLAFLCNHPQALRQYLATPKPIVLIPVDLNNLPENNLATLYRTILRSFFEIRETFSLTVQEIIQAVYRRCETARDPFLPQSALRELFLFFQAQETQVVLVLNRFDRFCRAATPQMTATLRGLRDSFRDTLCFIMGMREDVVYLSSFPSVEPLRGILDSHRCWVGPLTEADTRFMIGKELTTPVTEEAMTRLLVLTGGYPSLIRVVCHWWKTGPDQADWVQFLLQKPNVQHRLGELWRGLTLEEQTTLSHLRPEELPQRGIKGGRVVKQRLEEHRRNALESLRLKGVCQPVGSGWRVVSDLFAAYIANLEVQEYGRIWLNHDSEDIYRGHQLITDLPPLEGTILRFLIKHPRIRHTHDDLIEACWPKDIENKDVVSTDSVYQAIRGIRKAVEPNTNQPCYVINWRGQRGGGYQFFPEGKPE